MPTARRCLGVWVLLMLATGPAMAQEKVPEKAAERVPEKAQSADPSTSIPVPEIATRAEEVAVLLRNIETLLAPNTGIEAIEQRLPELSAQIDARIEETRQKLEGRPSIEALDELLGAWQRMRGELAKVLEKLTQRATRLEQELDRLSRMLDTWERAKADARASKAPAPVLARVDGLLVAIPEALNRLREERSAILVLQDKVARQLAQCEEGLDRVASFRQSYVGQILAQDVLPIWSKKA